MISDVVSVLLPLFQAWFRNSLVHAHLTLISGSCIVLYGIKLILIVYLSSGPLLLCV